MIPRKLFEKLRWAATKYPVVTLTGPRQSGKTTLVRSAFENHEYISLEDPDERIFAIDDPRGFLARFSGNAILDEVQRAPELFSYIQTNVDNKDIPGQFILTGSNNFLLYEKISQSLAGRCAVIHLLPLALEEIKQQNGLEFSQIGKSIPKSECLSDLFDVLYTGFYPRIYDKDLPPQDWLQNYYQTYLERDVRQLIHVGDINSFGKFVQLCAARSGQLLNLSSLAIDAGLTHTTVRRWLSILQSSFLVVLLQPYHRNFNKRLIKSPKLYFLDTGLLCYLLRIQNPHDLRIHSARGSVFETFVIAEFYKKFYNAGKLPDLYFWRDSAGHEVDLILEYASVFKAIEIKSGETITKELFKGLAYFQKLSEMENASCALIYAGHQSYIRNAMGVYSWSSL